MGDSLFRKVEPGEKIEPPKAFQAWATNTMAGLFAGMLFGGVREAIAPVKEWEIPRASPSATSGPGRGASVLRTPAAQSHSQGFDRWLSSGGGGGGGGGGGVGVGVGGGEGGAGMTRREALRIQRELMEKRFVRICRGSIVGGAQLSAFTGLFCGVQAYLAAPHSVAGHDPFHTIVAGSTTAAAFGLVLKGSVSARLRTGLLGAVLGSVICSPLAFLHSALQLNSSQDLASLASTPDGQESVVNASVEQRGGAAEDAIGIANVIDRLERRLAVQVQSSSSSSSDPSQSSTSVSSS
ncbi:hypothetical protein CBR_g38960 [Chara braunii]|uniref:Complex I assembly factor TIMMDC1, mitochondrial n=1 Tax=Chara braunii TaxID=69332 RepID=A0A388K0S6_CHABU|nr:hypothetical protein CBR_g38960 [Chara braunii]|eukprot:GBG63649.1 hypothetical protein CBR_g38960 [Chara braunii]